MRAVRVLPATPSPAAQPPPARGGGARRGRGVAPPPPPPPPPPHDSGPPLLSGLRRRQHRRTLGSEWDDKRHSQEFLYICQKVAIWLDGHGCALSTTSRRARMNMRNVPPNGKLLLTNRGAAVNRRAGRGLRIDEDLAEVAENEYEHAEHGRQSRDHWRVEDPSITSGTEGIRLTAEDPFMPGITAPGLFSSIPLHSGQFLCQCLTNRSKPPTFSRLELKIIIYSIGYGGEDGRPPRRSAMQGGSSG
jgi:hypothetical protein